MPKYGKKRLGRYAPYARAAVRGLQQVYGAYKRYGTPGGSGGSRRRGLITTGITTDHYDKKVKYRYKRMPRRKRRKYIRRVKFVQHVLDKGKGGTYATKFHVPAVSDINPGTGTQEVFGVIMNEGLPLGKDTDDLGQTSGEYAGEIINAIQQQDGHTDLTTLDNIRGRRWRVISNGFNTSLTNEGTDTCILDIYTFKCRRDLCIENLPSTELGSTSSFSVSNLYEWLLKKGYSQHDTAAVTRNDLGQIPFQNKSFCRYFKILKVQEVQLPGGHTTTLSMRCAKDFWWTGEKMVGKWCIGGLTQGYLFRVRGVPTATHTSASPCSVRFVTEYHTSVRDTGEHTIKMSTEDKGIV